MKRAVVDYLVDGVMDLDTVDGVTVTAKIHPDGRGYVKTPTERRLYANVQRIVIVNDAGQDVTVGPDRQVQPHGAERSRGRGHRT